MGAFRTKSHYNPPLGPRERLSLTKSGTPSGKPRLLGVATTFGQGDAIGIHDRDVSTLHRGLVERVFGVVTDGVINPAPSPLCCIRNELSHFSAKVVRYVGHASSGTRQSFGDTYRGRKRTIYQAAILSLEGRPVERRDASGKLFTKCEKINFTLKPDPVPRVIFPRHPRYNVEVGRRLKFVEHRVYSAIGKVFGETTVCKGLNFTQRAKLLQHKWGKYQDPVAVGIDMSRFDQHVSVDMLRWEHSVYNRIFRDPELAALLEWQTENRGSGYCPDGKVTMVKRGTRGSGDMNTALGNCLIMCAMVHRLASVRGLTISLANDGDDCAIIMDRGTLHAFMMGLQPWFLQFGFTAKVDYVTSTFEEIEFCQSRPVYISGTPIMVRNPRKALSSDICSTKFRDLKSTALYLTAMGMCGGSVYPGVPVYQQFYKSMRDPAQLERAGNILRTDVELGNYGFTRAALSENPKMELRLKSIDPRSRISFWKAFGVTPDEQVVLEEQYAKVVPCDVVSPRKEIGHLLLSAQIPTFLRWCIRRW